MFINVIRSNHPTITKHRDRFVCDALETNNIKEESISIIKEFVDKLNSVKKNFLAQYLFIPYIFIGLSFLFLILAIFVGVLLLIPCLVFLCLFMVSLGLSFYFQHKYGKNCQDIVRLYTEKLTDHYLVVDNYFSYDRTRYRKNNRSYDIEKTIHLVPIESKEKYIDPNSTFIKQQKAIMDDITSKSHANEHIPVYKIKEHKNDTIQIEEYKSRFNNDNITIQTDDNEKDVIVKSK